MVSKLLILIFVAAAPQALADAPALQTPAPVIYLADNLAEPDGLGWCIDTVGRGFAETLHAHSCKPQGGDVQFRYDPERQQIQSVEFAGKCMTLTAPGDPAVPFGLLDCSKDVVQRFTFEDGRFSPVSDPMRCVAVGPESRSAGPFHSRDLTLVPCERGLSEQLTWAIND